MRQTWTNLVIHDTATIRLNSNSFAYDCSHLQFGRGDSFDAAINRSTLRKWFDLLMSRLLIQMIFSRVDWSNGRDSSPLRTWPELNKLPTVYIKRVDVVGNRQDLSIWSSSSGALLSGLLQMRDRKFDSSNCAAAGFLYIWQWRKWISYFGFLIFQKSWCILLVNCWPMDWIDSNFGKK